MKSRSKITVYNYCLFLLIISHSNKVTSTGLADEPNLLEADVKKPLEGVYSLYRKSLSWGDAQIYCETHEGHLATFPKIEDLKTVIEKIFEMSDKVTTEYLSGAQQHEFGLDRRYWIGLTDLVSGEGNWVWAGKGLQLLYQNLWYPGQPDHFDKDGKYSGRPEHCGALWNPIFHKGDRRHSLVDQECKRKYYFICESDPPKIKVQKEYDAQNKNKDKTGRGIGRGISGLKQRSRKHRKNTKTSSSKIEGGEKTDASMGRSTNKRTENKNETTTDHTTPKSSEKSKEKDAWKSLPGFSELFDRSSSIENDLWGNSKSKRSHWQEEDLLTPSHHRSRAEELDDAELESIFG